MTDKVLADVNICLDFLLDRRPFSEPSGRIFELAEKGMIEIYISGLSFDTLFYIMHPSMGIQQATRLLQELLRHVRVAPVSEQVVKNALAAGWKDLEDALQYYSASEAGCDFLVTRDEQGYKLSDGPINVLNPGKYLEERNGQNAE